MPNLKGVITLAELHNQRCYLDLNPRQQKMVDTFIETEGDKTEAVIRAGYHFKNRENAHKHAHIYFARRAVKECLEFYKGFDEREQFIADLNNAMRNKHIRPAQIAALRLRAQVGGFLPGSQQTPVEPAAAEVEGVQRFPIGAVIIQDGVKYKVTAEEVK